MKIILFWLKRIVVWALIAFVALLLFYAVARSYVVYTDSQVEGERAPYLQMQAPDAISVLWNTAHPEVGVVRYGLSPDNLNMEVREDGAVEAHELRLTQLQPDSRYYYAVGNTDSIKYKGNDRWFMTAPEVGNDESVRVWVIGDSGQPGRVAQSVRDAMKKWVKHNARDDKPYLDQWITLGDNAYRSGSNQQYQAALFDAYPEILKNISLWPVYGNHDARRWTFFDIFALPEQAESGGVISGTENYYSFDYANIHYIVLDSQDSDRELDGEMLEWLQRDLQSNQQDWTIVAFHHPPYTKGSHDSDSVDDSDGRLVEMRVNVLPLLERYGVDLVLSGHSHVYERSHLISCHYAESSHFGEHNIVSKGVNNGSVRFIKEKSRQVVPQSGTIYIVAGASSKVDIGPINHPAMAVSMMEAGSLVIDIEGDYLIGRYINASAEVVDEFSIEKKADRSWLDYRNQSYRTCQ